MAHKGLLKDLILPHEMKYEKSSYSNNYGKFSIFPFDKGVGITIANSLRRVLLSAIPGYAITSVKIEGINHEFEPVKGVKEDLTDIILAIKKIRLSLNDNSDKKIIHINKKGPGEFTAKDFAIDATVDVINPELKIATLNEDSDLSIDVQIEFGRGYRSSEDAMDSNSVIAVIPVDAIFSPIQKVNFIVEDTRVGEKTDCEKIVMEVWSDGTISPIDAMSDAASILKKYFSLFVEFEEEEEIGTSASTSEAGPSDDVLSKPIDELDLSVRSYNCLKSANINSIGDLITYDKDSLMKIKNFGKKSLTEISEKLKIYNLNLDADKEGMGLDDSDMEDYDDTDEGDEE
ncbi:MAG: DNA-directed RNA polymerase subunit alpha [Spirochaetes bacterium GWF1_51_8]|nr:MAG: DNA-directed RNA polymerase subunit alpha [Spirochaetes bacterium GWF1_51_8]